MKFFSGRGNSVDESSDDHEQSQLDESSNETFELESELRHILKQIEDAKKEHDEVLSQLMPAKWELLDKKEQVSRLTTEYKELLSKIDEAKAELERIRHEQDCLRHNQ